MTRFAMRCASDLFDERILRKSQRKILVSNAHGCASVGIIRSSAIDRPICPTGKSVDRFDDRRVAGGAQNAAKMRARTSEFHQPLQAHAAVRCPLTSNITFGKSKFVHILLHPAATRGAYAHRHDTRGGERWTRLEPSDERRQCGRQSCVVLIPRRWDQVCGRRFRRRRRLTSPDAEESAA
jgi:hypothetical protein